MIRREISVVALFLVTGLCLYVAVQPILPSNSEHFSELGILGPQQKIANYPSNLSIGQPFTVTLGTTKVWRNTTRFT